ncbi:MAG: hypothetical protein ACTTH0_03575 [Eubacteriales bacterium]
MAGTTKRVKRTITKEEANNQYLIAVFNEFIAERKALGKSHIRLHIRSFANTLEKEQRKQGIFTALCSLNGQML